MGSEDARESVVLLGGTGHRHVCIAADGRDVDCGEDAGDLMREQDDMIRLTSNDLWCGQYIGSKGNGRYTVPRKTISQRCGKFVQSSPSCSAISDSMSTSSSSTTAVSSAS